MTIFYVWAALIGLCMGSFANACIYRWLGRESLMTRSHFPTCGHMIAWYDNIPILSWILLKGKCRHCHAEISISYPAVELSMCFFFFAATYTYGFTWFALKLILLFWLFTVGFVSDLKQREIPDEILYIGVAAAFLFTVAGLMEWKTAILGFFVPAGPLLVFTLLLEYGMKSDTELLGGGDIKFLMGIGALGGMLFSSYILFFGCICLTVMFFAFFIEDRATGNRTAVPMVVGFYVAFVLMFLCNFSSLLVF